MGSVASEECGRARAAERDREGIGGGVSVEVVPPRPAPSRDRIRISSPGPRARSAMPSPSNDRSLRVVYLDHTGAPSGAELALARLLPGLPDVEAHVILGEDGPLAEQLDRAGAGG